MKTAVSLVLALVTALAVSGIGDAQAKGKARPHLTQQVLSASSKVSLNLALIKTKRQVRLPPSRVGKF